MKECLSKNKNTLAGRHAELTVRRPVNPTAPRVYLRGREGVVGKSVE